MELIKNMLAAICTAIYIRVSTDKQVEKGYSIPEQDYKLKALCVAQGLGECEVYLDDGYSGKDMDRPDLQRLIKNIKSGRIKNIVIYKLDRLSRNLRDTLAIIEDILIPNDCRLISLTENIDTSSPVGRLIISILSAFAQLERETIKERMQMGMVGRVKTGKWKGTGIAPFGYDYDKETGILVQNYDAEKVKQLYEMYLQGYGLNKIAEQLGIYSGTSAGRILDNSLNFGSMIFKGSRYKGQHEPIISEEVYNEAMAMRQQKKGTIQKTPSENLLGNGLIHCGKCAAKMSYKKHKNSYTTIKCYSQQHVRKSLIKDAKCDNSALSMAEVENAVVTELFKIINDASAIKSPSLSKSDETLHLLYSAYAELEKRIKRLYDLYSLNEDRLLLDTVAERKKELSDIQAQIDVETKRVEARAQAAVRLFEIPNVNQWPSLNFAQKSEIIHQYINKIVITNGIMEIHWLSEDRPATVINIKRENGKIFERFMIECMVENKSAKRKAAEVYETYCLWSKEKGFHPGTKRYCYAKLRDAGILTGWALDSQGKIERNLVVGWDFKTDKKAS